MGQRITKRIADQLTPREKDVFVWDSEIKGFGIRCRPSGGKFYVLKTRAGGRQRWITIGRHGSPWTPDTARTEALRLLGEKAQGKDPAAERDNRKKVITVKELGERFLADHVAHRCKPKTACDYRHIVEKLIAPAVGHHNIADLSRADVSRLHHEHRDTPYLANRCLAVLSKMMNLAEEWGLRADGTNPCRHVKKYRESKRERFLDHEELRRLGKVLADAEANEDESPFFIAAIRLLIFTGARLSEITTLRWNYVDLANGVIRLPDSKTGAKNLYLNAAAIDVLEALPRMADNPFVIAGRKVGSHLVEMEKPWQRIRKKAGLENVRIHDLRHSFASMAVGSGMSLPMIGKLLGHTQAQTTARYAHLAADPVRAASNAVGQDIAAAIKPIIALSN
jgi:integrase